jgi:hypothetical protein
MSNPPNPALVAAAPGLLAINTALQTFFATTLIGDPTQIPLRANAAFKIFAGTVELQFPTLAQAEVGVVNTDVQAKLASWGTSLQALIPKA